MKFGTPLVVRACLPLATCGGNVKRVASAVDEGSIAKRTVASISLR